MDNIRLSAELIALLGIGATLLAAIIAGYVDQVRRTGQFPTRDEMRDEIRGAEERQRQETERLRLEAQEMEARLRQEIQATEARLQQQIQALQQQVQALHVEIRESTERIIDALASHRHPVPDGEPVFTRPA